MVYTMMPIFRKISDIRKLENSAENFRKFGNKGNPQINLIIVARNLQQ